MKQEVCNFDDLKPSSMKAITVNNKPIVVVKSSDGNVFALRNVCPHKGPCLSKGAIDQNTSGKYVGDYIFERETEVVRCPWHSWEFDIRTGCSLFDPDRVRVRTYDISIENEKIYVHV